MIITTTTAINENSSFFDEGFEQNLATVQELLVDIEQHNWRLDKFLALKLAGFSRHYLQQLIQQQAVKLANAAAVTKVASKVKAGQIWQVEIRPTQQSQSFTPQPIALEVVYQDQDVIVINKPAGLVVHPAPGNWSGTLLNALLYAFPDLLQVPRAGIVHRLDKDTSGLMVVARHRKAMDALVSQMALRQVDRQYLAVVNGQWRLTTQVVVEQAIGRDPRNRLKMAVVDITKQQGKAAKTRFRLLATSEQLTLLHCTLYTGRTHQIRVHAKYLGYPLLADITYGAKETQFISRQALHAWRLEFKQPITEQMLCFYASIPDDWTKITTFLQITEQNIVNVLKY